MTLHSFLSGAMPKNNYSFLKSFLITTMVLLCPFIHLYSQTNVALNKPAVASSLEQPNLEFSADKALDGNIGTRWASIFNSDNEWIYVDLGANCDVNRVVLKWEGAYASGYKIQISKDNVFTEDETETIITNGDGGTDDLTVSKTGRYVRVLCTARATTYGYSLYEFEVYGTMDRNLVFETSGIERMRIDPNGKVGIGTPAPDEMLTVRGNIHTQEVRVDMEGRLVPDYVFANDYKLKTLQEVEAFIKQNSHLPEIPSAQEIEKKGLMLAEMNMALLKKIEEMTLYMIEQNKEIEELKVLLKTLLERKNF